MNENIKQNLFGVMFAIGLGLGLLLAMSSIFVFITITNTYAPNVYSFSDLTLYSSGVIIFATSTMIFMLFGGIHTISWLYDKCEEKCSTDKKPTENRSYSHLYGTMGKPTFFCSKNFNMPNKRHIERINDEPIVIEPTTEPCGIHQADLWCIIDGNVCPNLIFGLEPIIEGSGNR